MCCVDLAALLKREEDDLKQEDFKEEEIKPMMFYIEDPMIMIEDSQKKQKEVEMNFIQKDKGAFNDEKEEKENLHDHYEVIEAEVNYHDRRRSYLENY